MCTHTFEFSYTCACRTLPASRLSLQTVNFMLSAKGTEVSLRLAPNGLVEYVIPEAPEDRVPHFPVPQPMQTVDSSNQGGRSAGGTARGADHGNSVSSLSSSPSRYTDGELSGSDDDKRDRLIGGDGQNGQTFSSSSQTRVGGSDRVGTTGASRSTAELGKMLEAASQRVGKLNGLLSES
jgi:hypothetical protein